MVKKGFLEGYQTYDTTKGYGNAKKWKTSFNERMTKGDAEDLLKDSIETPFSILGIKPDADRETIKKAFRKLIREWHPDRNQHRIKEAEERSLKTIAAYTLLTT